MQNKSYNFLTQNKVKPIASAIVQNSNKTLLGLIHVIVCNILGLDVLTAVSNSIYVTVTAGYTSKINSVKNGTSIAIKDTTFDSKKRYHTTLSDSVKVLNGKASKSTLSKFKGSIAKLDISSDILADYFVYYCKSANIDISNAKSKAIKDASKDKNTLVLNAMQKVKIG